MGCSNSSAVAAQTPSMPQQLSKNMTASGIRTKSNEFVPEAEKMLPGLFSTERTMGEPKITINEADRLDELAVVSLWSDKHKYCYTDGTHNNNNYKVQKGTYKGMSAYRVSPPEQKAKKDVKSEHALAFLVSSPSTYQLFSQDGVEIYTVKKQQLKEGEFHLVKKLHISSLSAPKVFYIVKQ